MSLTRIARVKRLNRPLLVTFDAYGTLYRPRAPIALMYEAVAKEHGMLIQGTNELNEAFMTVLRNHMSRYPNYGKHVLSSPDEWWKKVINETFTACAVPGQKVPRHLAPDLINRFSGSAFYHYMRSAPSTIKTLRNIEANSDYPVIIGVISNSDPRIASILRSFGFSVGDDKPVRNTRPVFESQEDKTLPQEDQEELHQQDRPPLIDRAKRPDFDFVLASYDAEYEKPKREIFALAERYAADVMRQLPAPAAHDSLDYPWPYPFHRLHVGDDIFKDAVAAANAGWKSLVFEDREFLKNLPPNEKDALSRVQAPRCHDLLRGVQKVMNEQQWCELHSVRVEMSEDSKEAREKRAAEARRIEKQEQKKLHLDPEKLAAHYERMVAEQTSASTPEKLGVRQIDNSTPLTTSQQQQQQQPARSEAKSIRPSSNSPSSSFSSSSSSSSSSSKPSEKLSPRATALKIFDNSIEWRTAGFMNNLTNANTSFLRPSNLQDMRKQREKAQGEKPEQQITRSPEVREQRALQRKRGKLLKRLKDMGNVPISVPNSAIAIYNVEKRRSVAEMEARKKQRREERARLRAELRGEAGGEEEEEEEKEEKEEENDDDDANELLGEEDGEAREWDGFGSVFEHTEPLEDDGGGGGDGGAARKVEELETSSAADSTPSPPLDVGDGTKKIDSSG
ncbi:hypothetical protein IWZ03DRAFT_367306 [Phyllosticta citriasiana]|uniref:Uncharacterized protein n=1 Tax=Phyllosticta citriasiana TaxID=595635 RepID=A0ABR1L078_9PEZI